MLQDKLVQCFEIGYTRYQEIFDTYYKFFGDVYFINPNDIMNNNFIQDNDKYTVDYISFEQDVLTRGMYFPFFSIPYFYQNNLDKVYDGNLHIFEGTHRLKVLSDANRLEVFTFVPYNEILSDKKIIEPVLIELDDFLRPVDIKHNAFWIEDGKFKLYSTTGFNALLLMYAHAISDATWILKTKYNYLAPVVDKYNKKGVYTNSQNVEYIMNKHGKEFRHFTKIN